MSTILFRRPARRVPPPMPGGELSLQEPPAQPEEPSGNLTLLLTFLPMAMGSSVMILLFVTPGSGWATTWIAGGLMLVTTMSMMVGQMGRTSGQRKRRAKGERRDYLRYLTQTRRKVRRQTGEQQRALAWQHPDPRSMWSIAMSSRLWERRPSHPDFAEVRIGTGSQLFAVKINPIQTKPVEDLEPLSARALRRFVHAHVTVPEQPVAVFLRAFAQVLLRGDPETTRGAARALLTQLFTFHSPDDVRIAVCCGAEAAPEWEWIKWLPHSQHLTESDAAGPTRMVRTQLDDLVDLFSAEFAERPRHEPGAVPSRDEPYTVVILDGGELGEEVRFTDAGYRNAVLIDVDQSAPWRRGRRVLRLDITPDGMAMVQATRSGKETKTQLGVPDLLSLAHARVGARIVSPLRLSAITEISEPLVTDIDLTTLLGIGDVATFDPHALWASQPAADRLRVPIGIDEDGGVVELDIKESALDGMGPHGMLIGATGSGKSELLRTIVLAMAATHSSSTLNFVLVDFKGGATFIGLDELPHTSALITNLADEVQLVARMQESLQGELVRRQELLRSAGNYTSVFEYEKARAAGAPLDPLPTLFVVVDEFSELLSAHREFIDTFVMIGRLGRSLAVHLLLASQRLDDGRIQQLETHLSYRIGLRTFSSMESRSVIGVPDAYELPPRPGSGYLRTDVSTLIRFKAAYASGGYRPVVTQRQRQEAVRHLVVPYSAESAAPRESEETLSGADTPQEPQDIAPGPEEREGDTGDGRTLLQLMVERLRDQGPAAHQVWLPPLEASPTLDELLPALEPLPDVGLAPADWAGRGGLVVPVGVVDRPFEQVRDLLMVDLSGVGGHVGIAGRQQGGKSTLLRTLLSAIAVTHTPRQAQIYCIDLGGGTLAALAGLPHVGGVATRLEVDVVSRTIAEMTALVTERERRFAQYGITNMTAYRQMREAGSVDDPFGDVFLVIDGWASFKHDFEHLEAMLRTVLPRMLNYGVHLILCANRWSELHSSVRDQMGTRLELRLGDPLDSIVDIRAARNVPELPGRGLTSSKLQFHGALPRIDGFSDLADLETGVATMVQSVSDYWEGPVAPRVRMLPDRLPADQLPAPEGTMKVAIGLNETALATVWHDFRTTPHLTVLGDTESGKTNLVRLIARSVIQCYGPDKAKVLLVDLRRELYDAVPAEYRRGYAVSAGVAGQIVGEIAAELKERMPGQDITPEQLRRRDWWTGPEYYVLVDDYDLVSSSASNPFMPLVEFFPHASDIGLHLVLARGASGRSAMDPLLRRLHEANTPDIALSCPPSEGVLLGNVRPRQFPPGRGMVLTRRQHHVIQTAFAAEAE